MEGCATSVENFSFSRGHVKLFQAIVKIVKDNLEIHGAGCFLLKLPEASSTVLSKVPEKENITSKAVSGVSRKRFKFTTVAQVDNDQPDEGSLKDTPEKTAQSTLIRKAITILVTHTPNLFAKVSIYFNFNYTTNEFISNLMVSFRISNECQRTKSYSKSKLN